MYNVNSKGFAWAATTTIATLLVTAVWTGVSVYAHEEMDKKIQAAVNSHGHEKEFGMVARSIDRLTLADLTRQIESMNSRIDRLKKHKESSSSWDYDDEAILARNVREHYDLTIQRNELAREVNAR